MIFRLLIAVFLAYTLPAIASNCSKNDLISCWKENLKASSSKSLPRNNQSFCYIKEDGTIGGSNIDKPLVIASVSKIFTSLWAINRSQMGPQHEFITKFYTDGIDLHIEGGSDPAFAKRSLYAVFDKMNQNKLTSFQKVTFDKNFYFTPQALDNTYFAQVYEKGSKHYCIPYTPEKKHTRDDLKYYFDSSQWTKNLRIVSKADIPRGHSKCVNTKLTGQTIEKDYQAKKKIFKYKSAKIKMNAESISPSQKNPFMTNGRLKPGVKVFQYTSTDLESIIKFINVNSANQPSDLLFHILGGKNQFEKEFQTTISESKTQKDFEFISGSGLSYKTLEKGNWKVESNRASCRTVLSILEFFLKYTNKVYDPIFDPRSEKFQTPSETQYKNITKKFMAVAGVEGTVARRFKSEFRKNFVAKTGTLGNGSSLVGTMKTKKGLRHFVMINNYTSYNYRAKANAARNIQYEMLKDMFDKFGKEEFEYKPLERLNRTHFKPYQKIEVIK